LHDFGAYQGTLGLTALGLKKNYGLCYPAGMAKKKEYMSKLQKGFRGRGQIMSDDEVAKRVGSIESPFGALKKRTQTAKREKTRKLRGY